MSARPYAAPQRSRCAGGCACGCCSGVASLTPEATFNRPGLSALHYRIGTHGSFFATMQAQLSCDGRLTPGGALSNPLALLRTRDPGDPAIALLDAWATVADVLTFYQERIANEGFLRTATATRSLFELSRLVGYQPRPGVAASVFLAYTIDENTPGPIVIPAGARAQTVPGQDESPQPFETSQAFEARARWNRIGVRKTEPQRLADVTADRTLWLAGTQSRLKTGDALLLGDDGTVPTPWRVVRVDEDPAADRTVVAIEPWTTQIDAPAIVAALKALPVRPSGVNADEVGEAIAALLGTDAEDAFRDRLEALRDRVADKRVAPNLRTATTLQRWLAQVARALAAVGTAGPPTATPSIAQMLDRLITPPSRPLADAALLPRSLTTSFGANSDTGLKVLQAAAPALKSTLATALAHYGAASRAPALRVWALRRRVGLFGRTFPRRTRVVITRDGDDAAGPTTRTVDDGEWPIDRTREATDTLSLDGAYDGILPGSFAFVDATGVPDFGADATVRNVQPTLVARIERVVPKIARADYGAVADTTQLTLGTAATPVDWIRYQGHQPDATERSIRDHDFAVIRRTVVHVDSEPLPLAERPIETDLCSEHPSSGVAPANAGPIELDGLYDGLEAGRYVIVRGERSDVGDTRGLFASEPVMITAVVHDVRAPDGPSVPLSQVQAQTGDGGALEGMPGDRIHTFVTVDQPLAYCYRRDSVEILGNVVRATHGETRIETLGSGDASKPLQRFALKQSPLTWLSASTASGAIDTLSVFVDDVRWHAAPSFVDRAPTDRSYRLVTDDGARTTVQFGNGREGARLPTGIGNVRAVYRNGLGRAGNVDPGQISQLATRPLGVREVTNPLRASGGADREGLEQIRRHAPLATRALDRLVSTQDYADFACTFAGIAKADATEISDGLRNVVHLTVAGLDDVPIDRDSDLLLNLRRALRALGDPFQRLVVEPRTARWLIVSAKLAIDPDQVWAAVVARVRAALLDAFGFERRALAQGVARSEVIAAMQAVPGVDWVDLDAFGAIDTIDADTSAPLLPDRITASVASLVAAGAAGTMPSAVQSARARRVTADGPLRPAELVILTPDVPETLVLNRVILDDRPPGGAA